MDEQTPILVGAGQYTQRDVDPAAAKSPLELMAVCAARAAADAGLTPAACAELDTVAVANILSWPYANAPDLLAARLGARPAERLYSTVGGNTPQWLVNRLAAAIAAGQIRFALVAGAEVVNTVRQAQKARVALDWPSGGTGSPTLVGDDRPGNSDLEGAYGLQLPVLMYPLFENAIRAQRGRTIAAHQAYLGALCSRLSTVAAENPHAWFRAARDAAELATVTPDNRFIAFPYPKYMNAILDVDQAAAVLMTSAGTARRLGIDPRRWVYLWAAADAHDHWFVSERVNYWTSPAIRVGGDRALAAAGLTIDRIDYFDLYSCFPAAVQIGRDMLGVAEDDPRPLTVTGGLPYHGGPGNNYSLHAIATMMDRLRARPGTTGLVTALGWYLTKHSIGIYSAAPPTRPFVREDPAIAQALIDREPRPTVVEEAEGPATVETYTVLYDRDGAPLRGFVIGRLTDGRRFLAHTPSDRRVFEALTAHEGVGRRGRVSRHDGLNRFDPA
jgi:acetyl-CoA C-acetyltransferase